MRNGGASSHFPVRRIVRNTSLVLGFLCALVGLPQHQARAQGVGDLAVAPTRVVLEGRNRTAQIQLLNRGTETAIYRVSLINMEMTAEGEYKRVESTGADNGFADDLVRYAPRQVELAPGKSQTVRILLRKPANLPDGEYRSHILFQAVPQAGTGQSVEVATDQDGLSIRLVVVPGITIPLIVRSGKLEASAELSQFGLDTGTPSAGGPVFSFQINRNGSRSLFGDVAVTYAAADGAEYVVGQISQLAVYTPNSHRMIRLPLRVPEGVTLAGGKMKVEYRARPEDGGKTIASAIVNIK